MTRKSFDLLVVGAGPAGGACALGAARAGLRVLVLEANRWPRHKVCGDCLNPNTRPILRRLGISDEVDRLPQVSLDAAVFTSTTGLALTVPLPGGEAGERAIRRRDLDECLLAAAVQAGAIFRPESALEGIRRTPQGWCAQAPGGPWEARVLVAADGRNSTTARLLGMMPPPEAGRDTRVSRQTHFRRHPGSPNHVQLMLSRNGYAGVAPVDAQTVNLCLVAQPPHLQALEQEILERTGLSQPEPWRSVTPLTRTTIAAARPGLFLAGDAARVVEPFTGEGIYYALRSGELAGLGAADFCAGAAPVELAAAYRRRHRRIYRGRLAVNRLARLAVRHPSMGDQLIRLGCAWPGWVQFLAHGVLRRVETGL